MGQSESINRYLPSFPLLSSGELSRYLDRIAFAGDLSVSLSCLEHLHFLHPQYIPFETINPYLGLPVRLDKGSLLQKLVERERGGYCFEHNLLFAAVLRTIGFQVRTLAARVRWQLPDGKVMPRDHMVLMVLLDGVRYLVDVGWGGNTLTKPLSLDQRGAQPTSHESFKLNSQEGLFLLSIQLNGEWEDMHQFGLEEYLIPDYEVISWYLCHHPDSLFVNQLIAARTTQQERLALKDNQFTVHRLQGGTEKRTLASPEEVIDVLQDAFRIRIEDTALLFHKLKQQVFTKV